MQEYGYCCGRDYFYRKSLYCSSENGCEIPINAHFYQYKNTYINPFHLNNRFHFSDKNVLVGEVYNQCDNCFKKGGDDISLTDNENQTPV